MHSSLDDWITVTVCFMAYLTPRLNNSRECKTLVPGLSVMQFCHITPLFMDLHWLFFGLELNFKWY